MYYLKYRPQKLAEIDNSARRELLTKLFSQKDNLPHAFLLTGPKGTGKTSTARIIAKILNCKQNLFGGKSKSPEPCLKCDHCKAIAKGNFFDLLELDGASNRGIDNIRELCNGVNVVPHQGRYKIYLIDEVHMLTKEAFNALLKTLEEPPDFVIFILATTEGKKLPATISSRCIQLNFNKATEEELLLSLRRICSSEKLSVGEEVLQKIAASADGSFRDAAKLLETLATTTDLSTQAAKSYFSQNFLEPPEKLLALLTKNQETEALKWLTAFKEQGGSSVWLIEEELKVLEKLLLAKKGVSDSVGAVNLNVSSISKLIKLFLEAYQLSKYSPDEYLPLFLAVTDYFSSSK